LRLPKNRRLENQLAELGRLRADPEAEATIKALRTALSSKSNQVVAEAARIAGDCHLQQLQDDLAAAFERLLTNPLKADPTCAAKTAIITALYQLGHPQEQIFLRGIRYVQQEPVYGGKEDTAAPLRVTCALALVRLHYPLAMVELAHLLADPEVDARIGAVQAIAYAGDPASVPLLHFKVLSGDSQVPVLYECFSALLDLSPADSLSFVAGYLEGPQAALCEAAALALGESHLASACEPLKDAWRKTLEPSVRRTLLLAIALLRHPPGIDFLVSLAAEAPPARAREALSALEMYRPDPQVWPRLQQALNARPDRVAFSAWLD
jgi:HEAT repeat protein